MGLKGSCPSVTARPGTRCLKLSLAPPYKKGNNGRPGRRDGRPGSLVFSRVTRGPVVRGRRTAWPRVSTRGGRVPELGTQTSATLSDPGAPSSGVPPKPQGPCIRTAALRGLQACV